MAKATNQVVGRVLVFYVLSVLLVVAILPWNSAKLGESPFVAAIVAIVVVIGSMAFVDDVRSQLWWSSGRTYTPQGR